MKRHEKTSASVVRNAASVASPAPIGSTTKPMPSTIDPRGYQFPNQYVLAPCNVPIRIVDEIASVTKAKAMPSESAAARDNHFRKLAESAAPMSGTTTGKGTRGPLTLSLSSCGGL